MEELRFNCPKQISKRFWHLCVENESTLGYELRRLMLNAIREADPSFKYTQNEIGDLEYFGDDLEP